MKVNVYLHFYEGECLEAFEFYKQVFGAENFTFKGTWAGAAGTEHEPTNEKDKDKIMHMSFKLNDHVELMGADMVQTKDMPTEHVDKKQKTENASSPMNNVSVSLVLDSREKADKVFGGLSKDGTVMMPLKDQFWGDYYGMCKDRFGICWNVNGETPTEAKKE